jgi:hypothetical protein
MCISHKLQNSKMQIKYFVDTDRKFQHTLRHKTVKLRIIQQPNHVRQKQFRCLQHYVWMVSNSGYGVKGGWLGGTQEGVLLKGDTAVLSWALGYSPGVVDANT